MDVWKEPPGGMTHEQRRQCRRRRVHAQVLILAVVVASTLGIFGYRWMTAVNPVDRSHAIDLFRAERSAALGARAPKLQAAGKQEQPRGNTPSASPSKSERPIQSNRAARVSSSVKKPRRQTESPRPQRTRTADEELATPEEGVYSWVTEGHEQVSGARRGFPEETQRIITAGERGSWNQHHYFSEDRQIWSAFQRGSEGVEVTQQRNKVSFGPVTRESKIDFSPPMLAAPDSVRVGFQWSGEWTGNTYGNYSSKVFERTTMTIGGEKVDVWGMSYLIQLRGEQEGRVRAQVWFAPRVGLTVKEHYVQDVESGGTRYHAEWMQTLKSLQPRQ